MVTNGTFKVDAAAQLAGKLSMMNLPEKPMQHDQMMVPEAFSEQINHLAHKYFAIKNALVNTNATETEKAAKEFIMHLSMIKSDNLPIEVNRNWNKEMTAVKKIAKSLQSHKDVEMQRKAFKELSDTFTPVVQKYMGKNQTFYISHCPMAFNNTGANWLSEIKEIRNPYFGDKMMTCGIVKEVIE